MKKSFLVLAALALAAGSVFAGGQKADSGGGLVIAGVYKLGTEPWFLGESAAIQGVVEAAGGKWLYMDAKTDGNLYLQLIDNAIAQKASGVLTCIPDQNLSQAAVTKLKAAGIPVIACDDPLQDENGKLLAPWVGIDAYNIGAEAGKWGANWIKQNNLQSDPAFGVMYLTVPTVSSIVPRTQAQKEMIAQNVSGFPANRQFDAPTADGANDNSYTATAAVISGNPQIRKWLVFAINDEGAQGASRALEDAGLNAENGSMAVGFGGYLAPDEFAKPSSPFKAAVYFSSKTVGETAAKELLDFIQNKTPIPERVAVSSRVIVPTDDLKSIMPEYF